MQEDRAKDFPKDFNSKGFLDFIRQRFGMPILAEEELMIKFTEFIDHRNEADEFTNEKDVVDWYQDLKNEMKTINRPLDVVTTDITQPHSDRRPSLEKRLTNQNRELSLAADMLMDRNLPKKQDKKPRPDNTFGES